MLYNFRDTNASGTQSNISSESFTIDGVYLENVINGYKTLTVSGRESYKKEIYSEVVGQANGEFLNYTRLPKRDIVVKFQLKADNPNDLMIKFTKLNEYVNNNEIKLIFADEPDKYFKAICTEVSNNSEGRLFINGQITFSCLEPFKYDVNATVLEVPQGQNYIDINNTGSVETFLNVKAEMKSDNGYIGVITDDRYFQQGNPFESDTTGRSRSETLLNASHFTSGSTTINSVVPLSNSNAKIGKAYQNLITLDKPLSIMQTENIINYPTRPNNQGQHNLGVMNVLTLANNFPDTTGYGYRGGALSWAIPNDSQGVSGAINFRLLFALWFETASIREMSYIMVAVHDEGNNTMGSIEFVKDTENNNNANIILKHYHTDGSYTSNTFGELLNQQFQPTYWNDYTNSNLYGFTIQKNAQMITYHTPFGAFGYGDESWRNRPCKYISVVIGRKTPSNSDLMLTRRYITDIIFIKDNVAYTEDIPNFFYNGSIWELDSETNTTYINNTINNQMRDIGNQPILLKKGNNRVHFGVSSFATMPKITVSYRQRYL